MKYRNILLAPMIQFSMKMVALALSVAMFTACSSDKKSEKQKKVITVVTEATDLETAIKHKKTITHLELVNEGLTEFPKEIFELKNLLYLDISGNKISNVEGDFEKLNNLIFIDLSGNELTDAPPALAQLKKLYYLHLDSNKIQKITTNMAEFQTLIELHLTSNPLTEFPSSTLNCKKIDLINCFNTFLTTIPKEILSNKTITTLWLPNKMDTKSNTILDSMMTTYDINVQRRSLAAKIDYDKNVLNNIYIRKFIPGYFTSFKLDSTEINEFEKNLREYVHIEFIDLSDCNFTEIPDFLVEFKHLKYLDLSGNQIKVVDFERLPKNLILLDLSNNQLSTEFKASPFPYLEYLFLEQNALRSIVLSYAPKLKVADLSNNSHLKKANISAKNIKILALPIPYKEHTLSAKSIFYR